MLGGQGQIDLDSAMSIMLYSEIVTVPPLWASEELMH